MSFLSLLNDVCTIFERVANVDADTGEQVFELRQVAENIPCALQNTSGNLDRNARLITGSNSDRLYLLPPDFEITKKSHVVEVRGVHYRITEKVDMGGRKRYLRLNLERTTLNE